MGKLDVLPKGVREFLESNHASYDIMDQIVSAFSAVKNSQEKEESDEEKLAKAKKCFDNPFSVSTDYEDDCIQWKNNPDDRPGYDIPAYPKREDYDQYGFKPDKVVYDGDLILDKYLVDMYGIDYARKEPRARLKKS